MKKKFKTLKYFFENSFLIQPIFSLLFGIIVLFTYFSFGDSRILFLLILSLIYLFSNRIKNYLKVIPIIVLFVIFILLNIFTLQISNKTDQSLFDKDFCALVTKVAKNRVTLNSFTSNNKISLSSYTMTLSNFEQESLGLQELDYICIEGDKKFYESDFGKGFSIENPTTKYKFDSLADYKNFLASIFVSPIDSELGSNSSLLKAIVLGVKDGLNKEEKDTFKSLGLMHLLVASGANIVIITNLITSSFETIRKKFYINHNLIKILTIFFAGSYLLLVGLEGSLTRAFFYFIILMLTETIGRKLNFFHRVLFASVIMLLLLPGLIYSYSFYLSVFAVFAIRFSQLISEYYEIDSDFWENIIISIIVPIFMYIPTSLFFGEINTIALFSNILLAPVVEAFVGFGFVYILVLALANLAYSVNVIKTFSTLISSLIDSINLLNSTMLDLIKPFFSDIYYKISTSNLYILIFIIFSMYLFMSYFIFISKSDPS